MACVHHRPAGGRKLTKTRKIAHKVLLLGQRREQKAQETEHEKHGDKHYGWSGARAVGNREIRVAPAPAPAAGAVVEAETAAETAAPDPRQTGRGTCSSPGFFSRAEPEKGI